MSISRNTVWLRHLQSSEPFVLRVVSIAIFTAPGRIASNNITTAGHTYSRNDRSHLALFGYLEDRCRFQRLSFTIGLALLGSAIGMFAFSRSLPLFIVSLGLQGLSSAATLVVGLAMIVDNVPTERIGRAIERASTAMTWASVVGPAIGGSMYDILGFYSMLAIPACLVFLNLGLWFTIIEMPERVLQKNEPGWAAQSLGDQVQRQAEEAMSESSTSPDSSHEQTSLLESLYLDTEARNTSLERKTTVFRLLLSKELCLPMISTTVLSIILSSLQTTLPIFVTQNFGWNSTGAGFMLIALHVSGFAGGYMNKIISQAGLRVPGATAFILVANVWILMRLVTQNSTGDIVLLVGLLIVLGMAIFTIEIVTLAEIFRAIEDHEGNDPDALNSLVPRACALFHIAFAGGQFLGPILAGLLDVYAGWATMTTILGLMSGLMVAVVLGFHKRRLDTAESEGGILI
ncbi:hypothetical protein N7456_011678 [Penicillium angulare]|uniref:Major facilitator superfamily (MFS) profile domain-containing protein n=1 Tax=Penicillium angulare TaxID=116970 RepID=A0A9W9EU55_9EURO|nr:hypothetical protein N7456_011678 [Penicillium angulare]